LYEKKPENIDSSRMEKRLMAALRSDCLPANTYAFSYWVHTGKKHGFFTTGGFLDIDQ
jgi:hypothetical protein